MIKAVIIIIDDMLIKNNEYDLETKSEREIIQCFRPLTAVNFILLLLNSHIFKNDKNDNVKMISVKVFYNVYYVLYSKLNI